MYWCHPFLEEWRYHFYIQCIGSDEDCMGYPILKCNFNEAD